MCRTCTCNPLPRTDHPGTETHPDSDLNGKLYGPGTSLEDVLAGKAKTFAEFLPLYRK